MARHDPRKKNREARDKAPASFFARNALSLVAGALLLLSLVGHAVAGFHHDNAQRAEHQQPPQAMSEYLRSGGFLSSLLENWESEFLQMGLFVLLTVKLRQRGSAESRPFDKAQEERKKEQFAEAEKPWPVRRGGLALSLYRHSLSIALLALFALSFAGHFCSSWRQHADEQLLHGEAPTPLGEYLFDAGFWFQSLQNWQSEFLAVLALVLLSIWLREDNSPQSKQCDAPHSHTGH
jgi:hypothetical protein